MNTRVESRSWYFYEFLNLMCTTDKELWYEHLDTNTLKYARLAASNAMPVYMLK